VLAGRAHKEKTGARGLLSVFERALIKFEKTLPSTEIAVLQVDMAVVDDPEAALRRMLVNDSIKSYQKNFLVKHGIYLEFERDAVERIQETAIANHKSVNQVCDDLFHDYPYGIKLMGLENFKIPREAIGNPSQYLDDYVRKNFKKKV
jgi:ATP-dependent Clp protease ATP-binding subunit ClpX